MRTQSGTTTARDSLHDDLRIFSAGCESAVETSLLTLLKRDALFGLRVGAGDPNPVISTTRTVEHRTCSSSVLQTERDKARVLEGLEGVCRWHVKNSIDSRWNKPCRTSNRIFLLTTC